MSDQETSEKLLDTFTYDNRSVAWFVWATIVWGIVGLLVGVIIALQLSGMGTRWGPSFLNMEYTAFGRLRPLHTNAVIFAFTGNAIFAGVYYSIQRLLKARIYSDAMTWFHFWSWQLIIVAAAVTLPLGITSSKEYAELEWPIDILITLSWVAFTINVFGTIWKRRERHLYVAIWFYIATLIGIAMLHVVNSLAVPVSPTKSYSLYAGQQDALVQWWYGHNAVAFFLTTPILGLMYYYLPKAAERPVYSYRLSIIHFWSLIFIYIWAGPHHLLHTALPGWAQTLGAVFSIMLIAPSWGGMINGLLTLRGAWDRVRQSPVLKFFVVAVTFYGMSTFEGPMMSLREVNALSHNTDWTIGHVHGGALGWVGFMAFGVAYWLVPRLYKTDLFSTPLANFHFWIGTIGIVLYVVTMWAAGIMQGMMWFQFSDEVRGILQYSTDEWTNMLDKSVWFYALRTVGGAMYLVGAIICLFNLFLTARRGQLSDETVQAPPLKREAPAGTYLNEALATKGGWFEKSNAVHSLVERWPFLMIILTTVALLVGGVLEIVPNMIQGALTPKIASVKPYTPLELYGRDIYIREGCVSCHTQMVRTLRAETARYGDAQMDVPAYTRPGEGVYDRPFLWGSKRTGPDLAREGILRPDPLWHYRHMFEPQLTSDGSLMPRYPHLYERQIDWQVIPPRLRALAAVPLATPYRDELVNGIAMAKEQALAIVDSIDFDSAQSPPTSGKSLPIPPRPAEPERQPGMTDQEYEARRQELYEEFAGREIFALIAYLKRLGVDITKPAPTVTGGTP